MKEDYGWCVKCGSTTYYTCGKCGAYCCLRLSCQSSHTCEVRKVGSRGMSTQIGVIGAVFIAIGFICAVWGGILTLIEHRRKKERMPFYDIERLIKASNAHWLYCASCERWWFTRKKLCARCTDTLEKPAEEILKEFMAEFLAFWNAITEAGMQRPYPEQPRRIFSENEVAGLMWVKQRTETARK